MERIFDEIIDRSGTNSVKWDGRKLFFDSETALPMWVADMDFDNAPAIKTALHNLINQQVLGYALPSDTLYESIINWQNERHQMNIAKDQILFAPGVVGALAVCIQAFSEPGEGVMINDPVYTPFASVTESNGRKLYRSPLSISNNQYIMDLKDIEDQFSRYSIKVFLLCNPHNPGGRVWSKEELIQLTDLCIQYGVILISDEIHSDLVYSESTHYSPVALNDTYRDTVVTLHSASKTFNIAGVKLAYFIVCNDELKEKISFVQSQTEQSGISTFGMVATEAAFSESRDWHNALLEYLEDNRQYVTDFFDHELPEVRYMKPEATYLFWFDASTLKTPGEALKQLFVDIGDVALNDGTAYGESSGQYMRLNFACPRTMLEEGLKRVKKVFDEKTAE